MLWLRMPAENNGFAALETYRNALDALKGFPLPGSSDPFDLHFGDIVPNQIMLANARIAAAVAANEEPLVRDVELVTAPGAPGEAWGLNIADEWPLASDPTQTPTPLQLIGTLPFPVGSTTFDFDTTLSEWVVQTVGP